MKVIFFEPYTLNTPHYETCLELMQRHLDQKDEVIILGCDADLEACAINIRHRKLICANCISKRKNGLKLLDGNFKYKSYFSLTEEDKKSVEKLRFNFETVKDLQPYSVDGFDIGYAIGSTIISNHREPNLSLDKAFNWKKLMKTSYKTFLSIKNQIKAEKPDRLYLFNGRFAILKAGFSACQVMGVDCFIHERGSRINKYMVFENHQPHHIKGINKLVLKYWERGEDKKKEQLGIDFYEGRRKGSKQAWKSFTKDQKLNQLPKNWDINKRNIVIFNSSEDEYASIGEEWKLTLYNNQNEGVKKIINEMSIQKDFHFYLRVHPNLTGVNSSIIKEMLEITGENFTLIPSDSEVSTYALIENCEKVLTFGSTAGIEATFWGKPSIMAGVSLYMYLDAVYKPKTHEELLQLLVAQLEPKSKEEAIKYGYYINTFGEEFKYFDATDFFEGTFKGKKVVASKRHSLPLELYNKTRKLLQS